MSMSLLQRARDSGRCPPSLLSEDRVVLNDAFDESALEVLDITGLQLAPDGQVAGKFASLLQKASSVDAVPAETNDKKKAALEERRAILLAIVAGTPRSSSSLATIISDGYLDSVKLWLDDVLSGAVGGVDFLLHLLSCIPDLPVTKSTVKNSGMGKAIGTIVKHSICKGTPNEAAIGSRVQEIKDSWHASVKAIKSTETVNDPVAKVPVKRVAETSAPTPSPAKKIKVGSDAKKSSTSFSSLMKKVSGSPKQVAAKDQGSDQGDLSSTSNGADTKKNSNKKSKRVKWSDHFGGNLTMSTVVEGGEVAVEAHDNSVSWSDRKKRDRMREKVLLMKARKAKLVDDEDEMEMPTAMQPTTPWRVPTLLPVQPDVAAAVLVSPELSIQNERMKTMTAARYVSDSDVPANPGPLTDVEQALDMTSQSSAVITPIPFFVPEAPAPDPVVQTTPAYDPTPVFQSYAQVHDLGATPEFVQSLGLPMFLVGQSVQALQTVANSPDLLTTLVDAHGGYDQLRLISLVQTLSSTSSNQPPPPPLPTFHVPNGLYDTTATPAYGQPSSFQNSAPRGGGYRGNSGSSEGNLHVSGYGPTTTQSEIIALFSPYVQVNEVVMKGTFSFVNTADPIGAQRAREALNGTLLGGMPVRINNAQRKSRDTAPSTYGPASTAPSFSIPAFGGPTSGIGLGAPPAPPFGAPVPIMPPVQTSMGQIDVDSVRDDRGNAATKNLFVAGYGPGTTEEAIRGLFQLHVNVIGVVMKGSFTFVNTADRSAAVHARNMLGGTMFNGGVLRINFAKETGRLGTSFDLTYHRNTGPNAKRSAPPASTNAMSYYGRGY